MARDWVDKGVWTAGWKKVQIIGRETGVTVVLVLCLSLVSHLLQEEWLGLPRARLALIEDVHFWGSFALLVLLPISAAFELLKAK